MSTASKLSQPVSRAEHTTREPLAVIGIGCRFPGGIDSPTAFWEALLRGINAIRDVPEDRWKHSRFHDTNPEKMGYIRNAKGGFIDGVDLFDGEFFGYFPAEAQRIDPQQRLLLEVTHEAMEDAGLRRDQLDGSRTSVFIGSFMYDYLCIQTSAEQRDEINPYVAMGTSISALANRISYDFNLKGPSVTVDTACSSSLVALHLACRSVWNGEADMAIAGGVNVILRPEASIVLSKGGFLCPDQYCKAFDSSANGYVRSEGVGVVILKPLRQAISDGDAVYALVRATGVNQDGFLLEGFTVPNPVSQINLLETVYAEAEVDPLSVDYVEAHGTGTPVGDPVESLSLGAVLGRDRPEGQRCWLGSVKSNLGHLEGAAGIAGFIKGVLTAHHGVVPPNLHFHEPNPEIDWENIQLQVPTQPTPLASGTRPRIVGVNSFGAGGTNAHVVIQEYAAVQRDSDDSYGASTVLTAARPTLYLLSAVHRDALRTLALRHADDLEAARHALQDTAFSAFARRSHYPHLVAVVGETSQVVADKLRAFANGRVDPTTLTAQITHSKRPRLAFVFSGQGGQWARMGCQLMEREPVFRSWMEQVESHFQPLAGWSLLAELNKPEGESRINDTVVVQPAVMAVQIALLKLYEHYGIRPDGIVGHSIGEVAAAFAAGALNLEQAVRVIYHRSQAQNMASGKGGMLAVGLAVDEARRLIEPYRGQVSIGAVNGPEMLTLSGDTPPLELIAQTLDARGVFQRPVRVQVAYHSHHMDAIEPFMMEALADVRGGETTIPLYSTVTGRCEDGTHLDAAYWFRNARQPVLFTDAVEAMIDNHFDTFLEIGPHPVLVAGAEALFKKVGANVIAAPSMTRREPEVTVFLQSLARLAARGRPADISTLFGTERRYVPLPKNPWAHSRHWFETPAAAATRRGRYEHPFLKRQTQLVTEKGVAVWEATLDVPKFPYLRDHQVEGEIVFPATGHLELAWAVASEQCRQEPFFLEDLRFDTPLILPDHSRHPLDVRLEIVSDEGDYRICSRSADAAIDAPWSKHSSGRMTTWHDRSEFPAKSFADVLALFDAAERVSAGPFYERVRDAGLVYGERFRCIQELRHHEGAWLAQLRLPDELDYEASRNVIHPALLDACLHVIFADAHHHGHPRRLYLPLRIRRVRIHRRAAKVVWAHVRVTRNDPQYLCSDTVIFDDSGEMIAEVIGLVCKRLLGAGTEPADAAYEGCYEYEWTPVERDTSRYGRVFDTNRAVLFADGSGISEEVARRLSAEGIETLAVLPEEVQHLDEILANVTLDRRTLIVFAAGMTSDHADWTNLGDCPSVPLLLQLAQALVKREGVPRTFIVTNGAAGVAGDRRIDLRQATLHGMARVIRNECPHMTLAVVDLAETPGTRDIDALMFELLHTRRDQDESEVALRGDTRYVRQLLPISREIAERNATREVPGCGGEYRAEMSEAGSFDHVEFRRLSPNDLGGQDVEIAVQAAGLGQHDIDNALGLLPEDAVAGGLTSHRLGMEVAGRVVRVGVLVRHVNVDDEVMARVPEGFCGRVTTPADYVVRLPANLTPLQGAGIPMAFVTAWYSLDHLARMTRGETVLIHSAADGVGAAAVQLARRAGLTVIATAGTTQAREELRKAGIAQVFDARSLDFHNQVMNVTHGRGVDIVLNSLEGHFAAQSVKCLAPFGRFVELGKSNVYGHQKLALERLGQNISYFVVDIDRLARHKPDLHRKMLHEIATLFEDGELAPLNIHEFPVSKLPDAMRLMARATSRGKIVLKMQDDRVRALPPRRAEFPSDRSYLITGGASGFGLEIAQWMAGRGARHLVLASRGGPKTEADRAAIERMVQQGVRVLLAQVDVASPDAVRQLLDRIARELPRLAGVIHGAAAMDDASIPAMNMQRFAHVFNPKAQGAWNLHEGTLATGANLDFFVLLSSISSALGFVGQVNYAAANYFQDALAEHRRRQGLPATAVNLGVLGQYAGLSRAVNESQDVIGLLDSQGLLTMSLDDILAKVEAAMLQQPAQRVVGRFDWAKFRNAYPHLVRDARFVDLLSDSALARGARTRSAGLRTELCQLGSEQRGQRLEQELRTKLARILDASPDQLDVDISIDNLGLDSLMLTDLQIWIARELDVTVPLIKLLKGPSIATLARELLVQLEAGDAGGNKKASHAAAAFTLADVEGVRMLNPWLIGGSSRPDSPCRLICFHSMGVGASLFTKFLLNPPNGYDILAVQTPGRENRSAEPVEANVDELVNQLAPVLRPLFDRPVVIWGHSFGGVVAWEVIRRLRDKHRLQPEQFVLTGTAAPHLMQRWQNREVLLKALVKDNSVEYLLSLSRYVDNPEFIKALLPGMRQDFPLLNNYRFRPGAPLDCPITAFAARQDDFVYLDEIREWARHTSATFQLIEVDGDHWFLDRNREHIVAVLEEFGRSRERSMAARDLRPATVT